MKVVEHYICEKCGTLYAARKDAVECEENHKAIQAIVSVRYLSLKQDASGYPQTLSVEFSNGKRINYKR